jgi:hypothetical protein
MIRAPAQPPGHLPALLSALVIVVFCIIGARAMSPGDALESSHLAAGMARGLGDMRSSVQRDAGVYPVDSRSALVTLVRCGEGRSAHAGISWQEGSGVQLRAQKWAGCPALGRDTWAGRLGR